MRLTRRRPDADVHETAERWDALATYNAEVYRGIVHTAEYTELMRAAQAIYDAEQRERAT